MTDTSNRTPPPGIEVIGELPPGVAWWDAEELSFKWKPDPAHKWAMLVIFVGVFSGLGLIGIILSLNEVLAAGDRSSSVEGLVLMFSLGLLMLLLGIATYWWIQFGWPSIAFMWLKSDSIIQLRPSKERAYIYNISPLWGAKKDKVHLRSAKLFCVLNERTQPADWKGADFETAHIEVFDDSQALNELPRIVIGPIKILGTLKLGADLEDYWKLLTYRIAKAKGENPPPPEFL